MQTAIIIIIDLEIIHQVQLRLHDWGIQCVHYVDDLLPHTLFYLSWAGYLNMNLEVFGQETN